ncbi:MAG: HEPN domain-containing protein [Rhodopseudomonas palustris]|nr:HEPN domain-containing protein [Rhodopseudomonas palustris]
MKAAEHCLNPTEPTTDTICFHCQRAVEKYLEALPDRCKGNEPSFTHNISVLLETCSGYDTDFAGLSDCDFF